MEIRAGAGGSPAKRLSVRETVGEERGWADNWVHVFGFEVAVGNALLVKVMQAAEKLSHDSAELGFVELGL